VAPVLRNLNKRISQVADEILEFRRDELSPLIRTLQQRVNDELAPQATAVLGRLNASSERLDRILGPTNEAKISQFLTHIDEVALNLNTLVNKIETTRVRMDEVLKDLDTLVDTNDDEITATVKSTRRSLAQMEAAMITVNENIDSVMYNLDGGAREVHELARSLRENPTRILRSPALPSDEVP
ncbi:MAG: hypothetical protein ACREXT_13135, partial [Gammaproteobacteria bacterium]